MTDFNRDKFTWKPGDITIRDEVGDESEFDPSDYEETNRGSVFSVAYSSGPEFTFVNSVSRMAGNPTWRRCRIVKLSRAESPSEWRQRFGFLLDQLCVEQRHVN
jgi:hypothetical protein